MPSKTRSLAYRLTFLGTDLRLLSAGVLGWLYHRLRGSTGCACGVLSEALDEIVLRDCDRWEAERNALADDE